MIGDAVAKPRRILVVALDNLGDLVFASALTPPLRRALPDSVIDVWAKAYTAEVARFIPHVSAVVAADPFWAAAPGRPRASVRSFLRSIAEVRARRYEVAIVTGAPWRTAAAVAAARIPIRIGAERRHNRHFLTQVVAAEDRGRSVLVEQARLLEPLGIMSVEPRYVLDAHADDALRSAVSARLPARFAALHPFAGDRRRCVPLAEWRRVAALLTQRGVPTLWIGNTRELDEIRREGLDGDGGALFADRLGGGSLAASAMALSLASVFAGHDSGPLHVAGAFGVPVVGVFAPGEPHRTFPQGTGPSRVIARPSPEGITAQTILREIESLAVISAS